MEKRPVILDSAEFIDFDTSEFANTPEVVSKKIDDHRIFGAVLFAAYQLGPKFFIVRGCSPAGSSALYRRCGDRPALDFEKSFGGRGNDCRIPTLEVSRKR